MTTPKSAADVKPETSPPPGFYTDGNHDVRRWWDGETWTDQYEQPPAPEPRPGSELRTAGWVTAILFPVVGFALSLIMAGKSDRSWLAVFLTSIGCGLLYYLILEAVVLNSI